MLSAFCTCYEASLDSGEDDIKETGSFSCGSLVNDLAMLYYTEGISETSQRRVMGLFKTYTLIMNFQKTHGQSLLVLPRTGSLP